jgi:hypothetical protein
MEEENKYYLYRHIRLDKNEPFYIGIGTKEHISISDRTTYRRAYTKRGRGSIWNNIVNKTDYKIEILFETNDYEFIKQKEIRFISLYGRKNLNLGPLANLTNGGDGSLGRIKTKEEIQKISNSLKGRPRVPHTEESKKLMSDVQKSIAKKGIRKSISTEFKKSMLPHNTKKVIDLDTNIEYPSIKHYYLAKGLTLKQFYYYKDKNKYNIKICV